MRRRDRWVERGVVDYDVVSRRHQVSRSFVPRRRKHGAVGLGTYGKSNEGASQLPFLARQPRVKRQCVHPSDPFSSWLRGGSKGGDRPDSDVCFLQGNSIPWSNSRFYLAGHTKGTPSSQYKRHSRRE